MSDDDAQDEGYIVEFLPVGKSVKVTAIDPRTLTEVSIVGPRKATERQLADLAVRKLEYMLAKRRREEEPE